MKLHDRVLQTTLAGGLGDIVIGAARVASYRALRDVPEILSGEPWFYCIEDQESNAFEIGKGTFDTVTDALQRNTVLTSSNDNLFVDFPIGTPKRVFSVAPEQVVNWLHLHVAEHYTLSNGDIAAKYVTTTYIPLASSVRLVISGAPSQIIGVGYTVDLNIQRVTWDGLTLDGLLRTGDKLTVEYVRGIA